MSQFPEEKIVQLEDTEVVESYMKDVERGMWKGLTRLTMWTMALAAPILAPGCYTPREQVNTSKSSKELVKEIKNSISERKKVYRGEEAEEKVEIPYSFTRPDFDQQLKRTKNKPGGRKQYIDVKDKISEDFNPEDFTRGGLATIERIMEVLENQENLNRIAEQIKIDNLYGEVKLHGLKKNGDMGEYTFRPDKTENAFLMFLSGRENPILPVEPKGYGDDNKFFWPEHLYNELPDIYDEGPSLPAHIHPPDSDDAGPSDRDLKGRNELAITPVTSLEDIHVKVTKEGESEYDIQVEYPSDPYIHFDVDIFLGEKYIGKDVVDLGVYRSDVKW
ncbi:MAG: hypothetical protein SVV03_03060 [Candidatus Nanohaloarchaea archaeon]|nr:hypothetical protein [Candidatus Nanohaloarchaea archaeon]